MKNPPEIVWARVRYEVHHTEIRTVEIPVPCGFDPKNPQHMLALALDRAKTLQPSVMVYELTPDFELVLKPPVVETIFPSTQDGGADRSRECRLEAFPLICMDDPVIQEVLGEFIPPQDF